MVGKGKSVAHISNSLDYVLNKDDAKIIKRNGLSGITSEMLQQEFAMYQLGNIRCEKNIFSFVISPHIKDCPHISNEKFEYICEKFMKRLGLENQEYIAVKHTPPNKRTHLHIYCNRILNNRAIKDYFIGKKCQKIANDIAKDLGLIQVNKIKEQNIIVKQNELKEIRKEIYQRHKKALRRKITDFETYMIYMKQEGVEIQPTINRKGEIQGFRVSYQGHQLKATEVHRNMSLSRSHLTTKQTKHPSLKKFKSEENDLDMKITKSEQITKKHIENGKEENKSRRTRRNSFN